MYFQLRKFNLPQELLISFYTAIIQSILCSSITFCFGSATKQDSNRLQYCQDCRGHYRHPPALHSGLIHVQSQEADRNHHCRAITREHNLLWLLPSGRRYRVLFADTSREKNSLLHRQSSWWTVKSVMKGQLTIKSSLTKELQSKMSNLLTST